MLLLVSAAVVAVATLTPLPGTPGGGPGVCLMICGERGLADLFANILLFLPLGVALGLGGMRGRTVLLLGALFSTGIELAQVWVVPGRDANPGDVLSNTAGAVLGAALGRSALGLLAPPAHRVAPYLAAAVVGVLATVTATALLLAPILPPLDYFGQWTESPGSYERYEGRVLEATVGTEPIPPLTQPIAPAVRTMLAEGVPLRVRMEVGPPSSRFAQLIVVADWPAEVLIVGVDGRDLVMRYRSRSVSMLLDGPTVRMRDALSGLEPGDRVDLAVRKAPTGFCLETRSRVECAGLTAGNGWSLLQQVDSFSPRFQALLNLGWLAFLAFPLGLWSRRDRATVALLAVAALGVALLPPWLGLAPVSPLEAAAAVAGWLAGAGAHRLAARFGPRGPAAPGRVRTASGARAETGVL